MGGEWFRLSMISLEMEWKWKRHATSCEEELLSLRSLLTSSIHAVPNFFPLSARRSVDFLAA